MEEMHIGTLDKLFICHLFRCVIGCIYLGLDVIDVKV